MAEMTTMPMEVITEDNGHFQHPSWMKSEILDWPQFEEHDSFLVFDADVICFKRWDPEAIFESVGRAFCAVPDVNTDSVFEECAGLGVPFPDYYLNGGVIMFGREHKNVWDLVKKKHPKCGRWLEQGAMNLALMHYKTDVCRLPKPFNVVTYRGNITEYHGEEMWNRVVNLHMTSMAGPEEVRQMQKHYGLCSTSEPVGTS
jgi:hypothetical protein